MGPDGHRPASRHRSSQNIRSRRGAATGSRLDGCWTAPAVQIPFLILEQKCDPGQGSLPSFQFSHLKNVLGSRQGESCVNSPPAHPGGLSALPSALGWAGLLVVGGAAPLPSLDSLLCSLRFVGVSAFLPGTLSSGQPLEDRPLESSFRPVAELTRGPHPQLPVSGPHRRTAVLKMEGLQCGQSVVSIRWYSLKSCCPGSPGAARDV